MSSHEIDPMQKYENYKEQFTRLNKALKNEFYLEAIFIEYAILEDRTESIMRHCGLWDAYMKTRKGKMPNIDSKLMFIHKHAQSKKYLLNRYFADDLMLQLRAWKNERNPLIHDLLNQKLEPGDLQDLAIRGNELIKVLRTRTTNHNRAVDRLNAEMLK